MFNLRTSREGKSHDKAVAIYSPETVVSVAKDLCGRRVHNRKDPEARWILERRGAILRRVQKEKLNSGGVR